MKPTLFILLSVVSSVISTVTGPFALYTKSDDPTWNLRYINVGARTGYVAIVDHIDDPSQIPAQNINYYINTTNTLTPDAPYGNLVWGAQAPYSALYGSITILSPSDALQPLFHTYQAATQGYSTQWNFTADGQLLLANESKFYGKLLHAPFWNYDAIHWLFGSSEQDLVNASAVTLWKYQP